MLLLLLLLIGVAHAAVGVVHEVSSVVGDNEASVTTRAMTVSGENHTYLAFVVVDDDEEPDDIVSLAGVVDEWRHVASQCDTRGGSLRAFVGASAERRDDESLVVTFARARRSITMLLRTNTSNDVRLVSLGTARRNSDACAPRATSRRVAATVHEGAFLVVSAHVENATYFDDNGGSLAISLLAEPNDESPRLENRTAFAYALFETDVPPTTTTEEQTTNDETLSTTTEEPTTTEMQTTTTAEPTQPPLKVPDDGYLEYARTLCLSVLEDNGVACGDVSSGDACTSRAECVDAECCSMSLN